MGPPAPNKKHILVGSRSQLNTTLDQLTRQVDWIVESRRHANLALTLTLTLTVTLTRGSLTLTWDLITLTIGLCLES